EETEKVRMREAFREEQASQWGQDAVARHHAAVQHRNAIFAAKVEAAQGRPGMEDLWARFDAVPCSQFSADYLVSSDKSIELAHYLASNPREAATISRMPEQGQALALRRIETRLSSAPANRRVSNYPGPHARVSGGSWSGARDPADMDYESFKRYMDSREKDRL